MTNFIIPLTDEQAARLRLQAEQAGLPTEEFLRGWVTEMLDRPGEQFRQAASYVLTKNAELYRRLA